MTVALAVDVLSWILLMAGAFFFVIGAIGMVRMPDVYTRMHAASVTETLGAGLIIAGMMLQAGWSQVSGKLFIIGALFFLTAPVATHALAQAALLMGVRPELKDDGDIADVMPIAFDNGETGEREGNAP